MPIFWAAVLAGSCKLSPNTQVQAQTIGLFLGCSQADIGNVRQNVAIANLSANALIPLASRFVSNGRNQKSGVFLGHEHIWTWVEPY